MAEINIFLAKQERNMNDMIWNTEIEPKVDSKKIDAPNSDSLGK